MSISRRIKSPGKAYDELIGTSTQLGILSWNLEYIDAPGCRPEVRGTRGGESFSLSFNPGRGYHELRQVLEIATSMLDIRQSGNDAIPADRPKVLVCWDDPVE